ncbi:uncharacterized protein Pyn_00941 [Prunus yedoensis var. nudiflora]|uniref:Uncharacterized protein n=1 Tax=Prunus yedoensis var. nudiflora TaxID=2094558 RepID=A0A314ZM71_PRUYE|nr:uncharacterized protein Pyn_00941 [Prunus yedoensis var. nudiflora]
MAAAEARTAWQCRANCRFVQEDVRIAPRFSSFPSSSSSKAESDSAPENAPEGIDHFTPGCMPYNPSSELAPNTKWWLNLEPNFGPQKEFTYEQLKLLEAELEDLNSGFVNKPAIISDYYQCNGSKGMQELKAETGNDLNYLRKGPGGVLVSDDHLMNLDSFNCLSYEEPKKLSSGLESQWVGTEKTEPWWRSAGKDELASLVAQKSLEHIENCDLPRPQIKWLNWVAPIWTLIHGEALLQVTQHMSLTVHQAKTMNYGTLARMRLQPKYAEDDRSKAELLEALCHSQTRARKLRSSTASLSRRRNTSSLSFETGITTLCLQAVAPIAAT